MRLITLAPGIALIGLTVAGVESAAQTPDAQARRAAEQLEQVMAAPRPVAGIQSVRIEELTWMEIRDALRSGTTTAIVPTGGIEQMDPETVRFPQRVAAGKATINGLPLEPMERTIEIGRKLLQFRVDGTVAAIRAARDGGG